MVRHTFIKLLIFPVFFALASCITPGPSQPDGYIMQTTSAPKKPPAEKTEPASRSSTETVKTETIGPSGESYKDGGTGGSLVRIKTKTHITFTGTVTAIDTVQKSISVKSTGKNLTFDLTNPVVRGYKNVNEIKPGDTITLGYIRNGIGIVKGENFHEDLKEQTAADELVPLKSKKKGSKYEKANRSNHAAPVKVRYRVNSMSFKDIDNNKDGRISPVELSNVIPNVTMEEFKKYDRNGDGGLDENEYRSVRKR